MSLLLSNTGAAMALTPRNVSSGPSAHPCSRAAFTSFQSCVASSTVLGVRCSLTNVDQTASCRGDANASATLPWAELLYWKTVPGLRMTSIGDPPATTSVTLTPPLVSAESTTVCPIRSRNSVITGRANRTTCAVAWIRWPSTTSRQPGSYRRLAGYLSQNPASRRYEPGWRLVVLGQRIQATAQVVRLARPVMTELRDRIGQTVVLSALTSGGVSVTDVVAGGSPIDVILSPGTVFQYNSSAQGKVALAFASPRQLAVWSTLVNEQRTPQTVLDATRLWSEVNAAREKGWADGPEETFLGVNAIAAPVFDNNSDIAYALAVVGSIHYIANPPPAELVNAVRLAADDLSKKLGQQSGNVDHARRARDESG